MLRKLVATMALGLVVMSPAWAQQQSQSRGETATKSQSMVTAEEIEGATIRNPQGDKIGSVDHVVIDPQSRQVKYAVVGVGGFLGMGEKHVAVPWQRMQPGTDSKTYVLNVDKQTLQSAPAVDMKNVAALDQPQQQQQISKFWQDQASQQAQTPQGKQQSKP